MDVNETNLAALSTYLDKTLNPDVGIRRSAEQFLESVEIKEGYARLLLALLQSPAVSPQIAVACAITVKNFVKRRWARRNESGSVALTPDQDGLPDTTSEKDRQFVKSQLFDLLLSTKNDAVRRQLAETISLISSHDFPDKWPDLLNDLIAKMGTADLTSLRCVLLAADSIFKRYAHEMKSDKLWREIKFVLDLFASPLLELFSKLCHLATNSAQNAAALTPVYECLVVVSSIFYSLNAQDLPEFFEDHMREWMEGFLKLLSTNVPCLRSEDNDAEAGVVEELWSQICDNIAMYAQKYDEEFHQFLPPFVGVVWQLLVSTGQQVKYDSLVSNAVQFLASVCERDQYKHLFQSGDTLAQICEKVVVPNIEFRPQDQELFEDNPEDFIRKDIEGSDVDTRRRSAADLVKALCKHFEADVIQIFSAYINHLFGQYASDPAKCWPKKDAAIYLVVVLSSKGQTARLGATKTSQLVNLVDFFNTQIAPDLMDSDVNRLPVLKADALKYVVTFRSHLPKQVVLTTVFPNCVRLLCADSPVVHSYAAHAVERLLMCRDAQNNNKNFLLTPAELTSWSLSLLQNAFSIFNKAGSSENEYAMKCIMRACQFLSSQISADCARSLLSEVAQKIALASRNPSKPYFNHYLFETLCLLIKMYHQKMTTTTTTDDDARQRAVLDFFEDTLFPPFEQILRGDVQEFVPYVFQVLSLVLGIRKPHAGLPDSYKVLFPFLLVPELWSKPGNIPGLVSLMEAYVRVECDFVTSEHLMPVLGAFQSLLSSKSNDPYVFCILNSLVEYGKYDSLPRPALSRIFSLIFTRITRSKTPRFVKSFIYFASLFILRFGPGNLIQLMEELQSGLFGMFVEKIYVADLQRTGGRVEKNVCSLALVKLLADIPETMLVGQYGYLWSHCLRALVALLELPVDESGEEDVEVNLIGTEAESGAGGSYSAAYSQLIYGACPEYDPTSDILRDGQTIQSILAAALKRLAASSNFSSHVTTAVGMLEERPRNYVQQYLAAQ